MNKTKQLFAGLTLTALSLKTALAEECAHLEGNVCLPSGFPIEASPSNYLLNLMKGVTGVSIEIYHLHMLILWVCVFIGIAVFGVMFYSIYHHRKSKGHVAAQFHENAKVELLWTVIPFLILVGMATAATKVMIDLHRMPATISKAKAADAAAFDVTIKVTGHQWYWEYEILGTDKKFMSKMAKQSVDASKHGSGIDPRLVSHYLLSVDKPLVIPINKKIRFVFTSADVIHSWWVPDLGWKKDANPGFINESWTYVEKPGVFRGQCTELCGQGHAFMPVVLIAMEQADYEKWLAEGVAKKGCTSDDDQSHDKLVSEGEKIYADNCASCHQAKGEGIKGNIPAITDSMLVNGDINAQTKLILNGKSMMPAFAKTLKSCELAQVITFTRNGLGNKKGDDIQPKAVLGLVGGKAAPESAPTKTDAAPAKEVTPAKADKAPAATSKKEEPATKTVTEPKKSEPAKAVSEKVTADAKEPAKAATAAAALTKEQLVAKGKTVYADKSCAGCHGEEGKGGMGPALAGSKVVTGDINAQVKLMMAGKGMMPSLDKMLDATELAAVVTYTRNALGNSVGDFIQPSAITALKANNK